MTGFNQVICLENFRHFKIIITISVNIRPYQNFTDHEKLSSTPSECFAFCLFLSTPENRINKELADFCPQAPCHVLNALNF